MMDGVLRQVQEKLLLPAAQHIGNRGSPTTITLIAGILLANLILQPDMQAAHVLPENGFGIDLNRVTEPVDRLTLERAAVNLGASAVTSSDLGLLQLCDNFKS